MDVRTFFEVCKYLQPQECADGVKRPPAVIVRGRHAVGKSDIIREMAKEVYDRPLLDRRIGQMTEGDLIGLAQVDGETSKFCPPDFIMRAVHEPVVLFFDEINRGTREVMQAMFQIVLDYELNGHKLHPQTRIFAAINEGAQYQVTRMDPALKDRFFWVDLEPTVQDWIDWANGKGNIDPMVRQYIAAHPMNLENEEQKDPKARYPSRRSWHKFSDAFKLIQKEKDFDVDSERWLATLRALGSGFIGYEVASDFAKFVKEQGVRVTARIILDDHERAMKMAARLGNERWNFCTEILLEHFKDNDLNEAESKNFGAFFVKMPAEQRMHLWMAAARTETGTPRMIHNIKIIHRYIVSSMLNAVNGELKDKDLSKLGQAQEAATPAAG